MLRIRLKRQGKRNDPFYRVVAIESSVKNGGEALAVFGYWNPREKVVKIDKKELGLWVKKGAQVSEAVKKLIA